MNTDEDRHRDGGPEAVQPEDRNGDDECRLQTSSQRTVVGLDAPGGSHAVSGDPGRIPPRPVGGREGPLYLIPPKGRIRRVDEFVRVKTLGDDTETTDDTITTVKVKSVRERRTFERPRSSVFVLETLGPGKSSDFGRYGREGRNGHRDLVLRRGGLPVHKGTMP